MLLPGLSVTLIGLVVGLLAGVAVGTPGRSQVRGVVAAWIGFVGGAFVGLLVDALLRTGTWLGWLGHAGAIVAAVGVAMVRSPEQARA